MLGVYCCNSFTHFKTVYSTCIDQRCFVASVVVGFFLLLLSCCEPVKFLQRCSTSPFQEDFFGGAELQ